MSCLLCACFRPTPEQQQEEKTVKEPDQSGIDALQPPPSPKRIKPRRPSAYTLSTISERSSNSNDSVVHNLKFARICADVHPVEFIIGSPIRSRRSYDLSDLVINNIDRSSWPLVIVKVFSRALIRIHPDATERRPLSYAYAVETETWSDAFLWSSLDDSYVNDKVYVCTICVVT